jgi:hypothetical protein
VQSSPIAWTRVRAEIGVCVILSVGSLFFATLISAQAQPLCPRVVDLKNVSVIARNRLMLSYIYRSLYMYLLVRPDQLMLIPQAFLILILLRINRVYPLPPLFPIPLRHQLLRRQLKQQICKLNPKCSFLSRYLNQHTLLRLLSPPQRLFQMRGKPMSRQLPGPLESHLRRGQRALVIKLRSPVNNLTSPNPRNRAPRQRMWARLRERPPQRGSSH